MALLHTPEPALGTPAAAFSLPDPAGQITSLADARGKNGLLVAFLCNHCPYVKAIAARLADDAKALAEAGIGTVGIMSNDFASYPEDAPEKMAQFAKASGWNFPYLVDADQSVARAYGAVCTPDFFGYDSDLTLRYRGRLDDAGLGDASQRRPELVEAMTQGAEIQHASMGCSIKWR